MRCKNCGWENKAESLKCEKCNAPLTGSMVDSGYKSRNASGEDDDSLVRGTVSEKKAFSSGGSEDEAKHERSRSVGSRRTCPRCDYQLSPSMMVCPRCGTDLNKRTDSQEETKQSAKKCPFCGNAIIPGAKFCAYCGKPFRMGTVNAGPAATPGSYFTLKALPWEHEHIQYQPMTFCGDSVALNRANTDPNNNSITSNVQAILTNDNGKWYIEDKSDYRSTYVRVNGKVELHDGDVIVLGNRMFEFRS